MRCGLRTIAIVVLSGLVAASCSGSSGGDADDDAGPEAGVQDSGSPTSLEPFEGGDFYAVPDPLPAGDHGTLIRYEPVDGAMVEGGTTWRVMYLSESLEGEPIAVTGTVVVPDGEAPEGGRELVTIAHGTTGIADECAPSKGAASGVDPLAVLAVGQGYVIATSDYEGLGTPGRHPYLVGESEGRGVLDAAVAAGQLPGAQVGDRFAIAGYSQGGHGALWAGQLAEEWAPDLELVGTFAGAPATELPVIFSAAGSLDIAGFLYMIIAGFADAYPDEADPALLLTPAGMDALDEVDTGCVGDVLGRYATMDGAELLEPDTGSIEPWATLAEDNNPGNVSTDTPILIIHSAADEVVPAALSELLFTRMCGLGQQAERRLYDDGQGHGAAAAPAYVDGFTWIGERFADQPAASTCPEG